MYYIIDKQIKTEISLKNPWKFSKELKGISKTHVLKYSNGVIELFRRAIENESIPLLI